MKTLKIEIKENYYCIQITITSRYITIELDFVVKKGIRMAHNGINSLKSALMGLKIYAKQFIF